MIKPRRIDYADCYQGLIKLILEEEKLPTCYMNTESWGFFYDENVMFDINRFQFNSLLKRYYGLEISRVILPTAEAYIDAIKAYLSNGSFYVLIKAEVSSCQWHDLASYSDMYHFLLVTDCSDNGIVQCIDIFYPDDYHEYDIAANMNKFRKLAVMEKKDASINMDVIRSDFYHNIEIQLNTSPSYSEKIIAFSKSDFFAKVFNYEDKVDYDRYLLSAKRLLITRTDTYEILKELMPQDEELLEEYEQCIKLWRKFYNHMIKNLIVPAKRESIIEKSSLALQDIAKTEEPIMRRILDNLRKDRLC